MTTIKTYFEGAQLSIAAYADLNVSLEPIAYVRALLDVGMSETQARKFVGLAGNNSLVAGMGYEIIDQLPNTNSGFSATVFKRADQYYLAIRGTESPSVFFSSANDW